MNAQSLVAKVRNFAHVLRDQGVSCQTYISQISYRLFDEVAAEIVESLETALARFRNVAKALGEGPES